MTSRGPALPWLSTLCWASVGALGSFGVAGLASIGLFLLAGAAVIATVALLVPALRPPCLPGFVVGLSTAPLYIAWLNRGGPGLVCTSTADSMECIDQWSPWPFLAVGVLFAGAGLALLLVGRRRASGPTSTVSAEAAGPVPRT